MKIPTNVVVNCSDFAFDEPFEETIDFLIEYLDWPNNVWVADIDEVIKNIKAGMVDDEDEQQLKNIEALKNLLSINKIDGLVWEHR